MKCRVGTATALKTKSANTVILSCHSYNETYFKMLELLKCQLLRSKVRGIFSKPSSFLMSCERPEGHMIVTTEALFIRMHEHVKVGLQQTISYGPH